MFRTPCNLISLPSGTAAGLQSVLSCAWPRPFPVSILHGERIVVLLFRRRYAVSQ